MGVVSRSQRDIEANKVIEEALKDEERFFLESPSYRDMKDKMGTQYLQRVLNKELSTHIKAKISEIRFELLKKCKEVDLELEKLGYEEKAAEDLGRTIFRLMSDFVDNIFSSIDGSGDELDTKELIGGAKINQCFCKDFNKYFKDTAPICDGKEIGVAIANSHGVKNALVVPVKAFDKIVQNLLDQYELPMQKCVQHVREILEGVIQDSMSVLAGYPMLKREVSRLVYGEIDKNAKEATDLLLIHIEAQKAFVNTRHPDFKRPSFNYNENEKWKNTDDIQHTFEMVQRYKKIADTGILDTIAKYTMLKLGKTFLKLFPCVFDYVL